MAGKIFKNNKGSVLVEVAAMFMLITMMAVGYIHFVSAMRVNTVIKIAAREGAREYSVSNSASRAKEKVRHELSLAGINPDEKAVSVNARAVGKKRIVDVKAKNSFYAPFSSEYKLNLKGGAEYHLEDNPEFK